MTNVTFGDRYEELKQYPSQGARSDNDDVPSRPTVARYAATAVLGEDPFDEAISSETRTVLAVLNKMVTETDDSVAEIREQFDTAQELRDATEEAVLNRFPSGEDAGFALTGSVNHSAPAIAAIAQQVYGVDPIEAVRNHLDGETARLTNGEADDEVEEAEA